MSSTTTPPLAFVDTESSHLDERYGHAWEIAVIRRDHDGIETENLWQVRIDLTHASPQSLEIGGYHQRFAVPEGWDAMAIHAYADGTTKRMQLTRAELIDEVGVLLAGAVMVGSNPAFDDRFLRKLYVDPPWHYRTVDFAAVAAGHRYGLAAALRAAGGTVRAGDLPSLPYNSRDLSRYFGVEPPAPGVAHTAMGDAKWARDVFLAVTGAKAGA